MKKRTKKIAALLLCLVLVATLFASCTDNTATTSPSAGTEAQVIPYTQNPARETCEISTDNQGNITYTTYRYKYTPASTPVYTMGKNLAYGKTVTTNSILDPYTAKSAVDGNTTSFWASSDDVQNPYLQIDLGEAYKIGAVEFVPRYPNGNIANFELQLSNEPEFKEYVTIGGCDADGFETYSFIVNCDFDTAYRYVRYQGKNDMGHTHVAELKVYADQMQLVPERAVETAPAGAMQIISKSTGKALMNYSDVAVLSEYTFRNAQRWIVEDAGNNTVKLKNCANNNYLSCANYKLYFSDTANTDSQLWVKVDKGAGWVTLTNKTGGMLTVNEGYLAVSNGDPQSEDTKWNISAAYVEDIEKADATWLQDCYGVMYHLLPSLSNRKQIVRDIDIDAICDQLVEAGASYFLLSFGQNSGYFLSPNDTFASIVTLKPDTRKIDRDLFREFAEALKARGIKLMAYTTSQPPAGYTSDHEAFLIDDGISSRESAMLWSMVLREWSLEYGDLISGWWVDGGYLGVNPNTDILDILVNGMKAGNPDTVIAINPGIFVAQRGKLCEITAGETDFPLGSEAGDITDPKNWLTPENDKVADGVQWFELTFLNVGWCFNQGPRNGLYDKELWATYVDTVLEQDGAICLDVTYNPEDGYKIIPEMMNILKTIKAKQAS